MGKEGAEGNCWDSLFFSLTIWPCTHSFHAASICQGPPHYMQPPLSVTPSLHISDPLVTCSIYSPVTHPRYMQHLLASDPLVTCSLHYQWHPPYMQHLLTRDPLLTGSLYLPVTHSVHIASAHQCEDFRKEMELSILCDWNCRGFSIDGMQLFNLDCSQSQHSCDCSASFVFL